LGYTFDSSTGFKLPNGATRSPDAAWTARDRWESLSLEARETFTPIAPDFVIELRSATDSLSDRQDKMREYQANGVRLGWLINPPDQTVEIYRLGQSVEILKSPAILSGETVLIGFELSLERIW
jgi:Uma2 family endonuclease